MARKSRKNTVAPEPIKKPAEKIWHAALYIRLSSEFNGGRGDSLETQRQIMETHLALYPDIEIVQIYTDNGVSGQTFERVAFQEMLHDVEAGKINCIVTKDLSRLGRNVIDTGYYIEKYFPLHQVRFISVNDQYDSEDTENSGNHLIVPLKNMINEAYAIDIGKKTRAQKQQAINDGEFIGSRPPYGYRKDPDNCHKLLVNDDTAPVVRQIFEWAADGIPIMQIVRMLNEKDILTPGYYLASIGIINNQHLKGSGHWQTWTVNKILADEVYLGKMVQGKTKSVRRKQIPVDSGEWVTVCDTHEPIISRELFEKAHAKLELSKQKHREKRKAVPYSPNILKGRIFCGCCGRALNRHRDNRSYVYSYSCIADNIIGQNTCANGAYILERRLFESLLTIIRCEAEIVIGNRLRLKQYDSKITAQRAAVDKEISGLQAEAEKNQMFLAGLYENFVQGILTKSEYLEMKADYSQKIKDAAERVRQLQEHRKSFENQLNDYISLADRLAAVEKDTSLSAQLVNQLIENITVSRPHEVSVKFRFERSFRQIMEVLEDE